VPFLCFNSAYLVLKKIQKRIEGWSGQFRLQCGRTEDERGWKPIVCAVSAIWQAIIKNASR
jgi:hypothetical protein